ncbi:MAG: hypothetical protein ACOZQL_23470 [Myxococcota bacterium]
MRWCSEQVPLAGLEAGVAGVCAASHEDRPRWFFVTMAGRVLGFDLDDGATFFTAQLPFGFAPLREPLPGGPPSAGVATVVTSRDGRFLAVVETWGRRGAVFDVARGVLLKELARGDYHPDVSGWAVAIRDDVLVVATEWNRLEAWRLPSCERLAPASDESELDYFWGLATLSPQQRSFASFGWHWHPVGTLRVVELERWLSSREDPPPMPFETVMADWWDASVCWLDERRLVLVGSEAKDDDWYMASQDGLLILDLETRAVDRFLPGLVSRELAFDGRHLILLDQAETRAVALDGEVLARHDAGAHAWHPGTHTALRLPDAGSNVVSVHWVAGALGRVDAGPTDTSPGALAVLADALEEQGGDAVAIAHCRAGGPHGRRCWVVEGLR